MGKCGIEKDVPLLGRPNKGLLGDALQYPLDRSLVHKLVFFQRPDRADQDARRGVQGSLSHEFSIHLVLAKVVLDNARVVVVRHADGHVAKADVQLITGDAGTNADHQGEAHVRELLTYSGCALGGVDWPRLHGSRNHDVMFGDAAKRVHIVLATDGLGSACEFFIQGVLDRDRPVGKGAENGDRDVVWLNGGQPFLVGSVGVFVRNGFARQNYCVAAQQRFREEVEDKGWSLGIKGASNPNARSNHRCSQYVAFGRMTGVDSAHVSLSAGAARTTCLY